MTTSSYRAQGVTASETGGARLRRAVPEFEVFSFKIEAEAGLES